MNTWKRYSMLASKNWVNFNKMFTLSPWLFTPRVVHIVAIERTGTEYSWAKRAAGIGYIGIDHLMLLTLFGK